MRGILLTIIVLAVAAGNGCMGPLGTFGERLPAPGDQEVQMVQAYRMFLQELIRDAGFLDREIEGLLERDVELEFPARLAALELSSLNPARTNAFLESALPLLAESGRFQEGPVVLHTSLVYGLPFAPVLRHLAAQAEPEADLILFTVFEWDDNDEYLTSPLALFDVLMVGAFILPSHVVSTEGWVAAYLFHVRSGKFIAWGHAAAEDWTLCTGVGRTGALRRLRRRVAADLYRELAAQLTDRLDAFAGPAVP